MGINIIIYSFISVVLIISTTLILFVGKYKWHNKFLVKNRLSRIDRKKFIKMYLVMTGIFLLGSHNNPNFFWWDAVILSSIISYMVILYGILNVDMSDKEKDYLKSNEKSFKREEKLNKILKKNIFQR